MFKSLLNVATDVTKIVTAPVEMALDATRTVTKPVADGMEEMKDDFKDMMQDVTDKDVL